MKVFGKKFGLLSLLLGGLVILFVGCAKPDTGKLAPQETDGQTAADIDTNVNQGGTYPNVGSIRFETPGPPESSQWIFYTTFNQDMDTSLTPEILLQKITDHNTLGSEIVIESVSWIKDDTLSFTTTDPFDITSDYLLTIKAENTQNIAGFPIDGNAGGNLDDFMQGASDYLMRLSNLAPPIALPNGPASIYVYDFTRPQPAGMSENGWYLNPYLDDTGVPEYLELSFTKGMDPSTINSNNIEILDLNGNPVAGDWFLDKDDPPDGIPDETVDNGEDNTEYFMFWFRPESKLELGEYRVTLYCDNLLSQEIDDDTNLIYKLSYAATDGVADGGDNTITYMFYITEDGLGGNDNFTTHVFGVFNSADSDIFAGEINPNQVYVVFYTSSSTDDLMDTTTLTPDKVRLSDGGANIRSVTTSAITRYINCVPTTVWIITAPNRNDITGDELIISYQVLDPDGNTLDGNSDGFYENNYLDNFKDTGSFTPDLISPAFTAGDVDVYTMNAPGPFSISDDEVYVTFDTPSFNDDLMDTSSLTGDRLIISNLTITSAVTSDEDVQGILTTVWKITASGAVSGENLSIIVNPLITGTNQENFTITGSNDTFEVAVDGGNMQTATLPQVVQTAAQIGAEIDADTLNVIAADNGDGYVQVYSNNYGLNASVKIGAGNANSVLGFTDNQSSSQSIVDPCGNYLPPFGGSFLP